MTKTSGIVAAITIAVTGMVSPLAAQTPLKDVAEVRNGIIYVGMAYEISRKCDDIGARTWRGLNYLQSLKRRASDLGYSDAQIDAYVDDDAEKDRLESIARQQLRQLGVVPAEPATYCAVGHAQIAANTRVGWLLR
ncbi:hypothetical protein CLV80_101112 [Yoonia maritima]|uniref:Uncharacterized protein n=1 Tax=Yoonia maritima TaxID=1435347 RepID=A0A2T0W4F4_9RHOB|nr:DUF5333 domain-containing protein [Yoonia maritima]PRY80261.1 hypothetical protein CLV80_101112 [Yoonia maritima]